MAKFYSKFLPKKFRKEGVTIPVVRMSGVISAQSGGFQRNTINLANVAGQLDKAFKTKDAPAVAISINSPGGSPVQSRLIYRRIRDLASENNKKVLVFCEDVAASGGYFIACAGDEIIADPSSIVGSIGVIYAGFGFTEAIGKLGVERRVYTSGKNKSTLDPFQPAKDADVARIKAMGEEIHQVFIDHVKQSRGERLADNDDLFTGAFWSGLKAKELGLVDEVSDMRTVLKDRYGDDAEMKLVSAPRNLFGRRVASGIMSGAGSEEFAQNLASGALTALEERALWAKFGL